MRISLKTYLLFLITITAVFFIFSLYLRPPHIDDTWIGEHAYWLAESGVVKSELMRGVTLQEERLVVHHKLLVYQGAALISIFGFSLYTLKSVSLIYFVIFLLVFFIFIKKKYFNHIESLFAILLIISNALCFEYAFIFRPEIPLMTLGFLSFIFLMRALDKNGSGYWNLFTAGLIAGLSVSMHLNGLIFLVSGFLLLIWNRKFTYGIIFAASSLPTIFIYFIDMLSISRLQLWYYQMFSSPSVDSANLFSGTFEFIFNRIIKTLMLFVHSPREISFSVLMISIIALTYKHLRLHRNLLRYTFLLIISLAFLAAHTSSKYMLLYFPYLVIIGTLALRHIYNSTSALTYSISGIRRKVAVKAITLIVSLYLVTQMIYQAEISFKKFDKAEHHNLIARYIDGPTAGLNIVAPMNYLFDEIESFNRIQSDLCYGEMSKADGTIYQEGFLELAESYGNDYLFLRSRYIKHFGIDLMTDDEIRNNHFDVILRTNDLAILKRNITGGDALYAEITNKSSQMNLSRLRNIITASTK